MTRRKKTPRKTTRRKSSQKKDTTNRKIIYVLLIIIVALLAAIVFLIYTINSNKTEATQTTIAPQTVEKVTKKIKDTKDKFDKYFDKVEEIKKDKFEEYTKDFYKEYSDTNEPKQKETEKKEAVEKPAKEEPTVFPASPSKPKLAIIFDDVTTPYQIRKIKDIGFTVTFSIMPPTKRHPDSAKIAKDLPFYMIHFPLQAKYFKNEESSTLHVGDSYEKIEKRVAQIRSLYPRAKYTNNHTGSEFTSNKEAMDKLFKALTKYGFIFVDSRTTGKSVGKEMAKKYNMPYISRNVFLDNEQKYGYIRGQLKKAVAIAKKNGFAIAICHPHPTTISTLKKSKDLLQGLEMIQLDKIPTLNE